MIFSPRSYGIFCLTSTKKFIMSLEKDCFDQVVFKWLTESIEKQIMSKVRFSHAKQMFLYYLTSEKNNWLKETLSHLASWTTCTCWCAKFSSHLGEVPAKSNEISPRQAGSLFIWAHYVFIEVFLKKVRSHLGDPAHLTGLTSIWTASKTTKQSKEYVWLLLSSWIVICLRWRSKKGK